MGRVITPEIMAYLELESIILEFPDGDHPADITIINPTSLWLLLPQTYFSPDKQLNARFRFAGRYYTTPLRFLKSIKQCDYELAEFDFRLEAFPVQIIDKLQEIFILTEAVQRRQNERLELDDTVCNQFNIVQEATFHYGNMKQNCILKDISFSGCRFICFGKNYEIVPGISVAVRIRFTNPHESFPIFGKLLRKTIVKAQDTYLSDCAVQFRTPVNMFFEKRLFICFN